MGHIIPKLNLNKTPQAVDSNSLVFAKNIKVNQDGSLGRDNAISLIRDLSTVGGPNDSNEYLGHIVGVNGCIYFFVKKYRNDVEIGDFIYEYDEVNLNNNNAPKFTVIPCGWHWSGGKITGCVTTNNTNQKILTISEYFDDNENNVLVPLKHINLSECRQNDDESIYTQNPNIPITNLHFAGYYSCTIPNGVYQFFVRYKVRDGFYTNWFPASKELYAGAAEQIRTIQGNLRYVDIERDCPKSFIFEVNHLFPNNNRNYKEFQVGFIVSSGNATVGRTWKSFPLSTSYIYFNYDNQFIEEELVDNFLRVPYEIYNAKNVINYKSKLYISNYIESNINDEELASYNRDVTIELVHSSDDLTTNTSNFLLNNCVLTKTDNYYTQILLDSQNQPIKNIFLNEDFVAINTNYNGNTENYIDNLLCYTIYNPIDIPYTYSEDGSMFITDGGDDLGLSLKSSIANHIGVEFNKSYICKVKINYVSGESEVIYELQDLNSLLSTLYSADLTGMSSIDEYLNLLATYRDDYETIFDLLNTSSAADVLNINYKNIAETLKLVCENHIRNYISGINAYSERFSVTINSETNDINNVEISFCNLNFIGSTTRIKTKTPLVPIGIAGYDTTHLCFFEPYITTTIISFTSKTIENEQTVVAQNIQQIDTLMPFTEYNFYIHYVKENGITTNGYYIGTKSYNITANNATYHPNRVIPSFSNIVIPDGYVSYFISIAKIKNNIINVLPTDVSKTRNAIELDALLYNSEGWRVLKLGSGTPTSNTAIPELADNVTYYGSNFVKDSSSFNTYFGNCGVVVSDTTTGYKFIKSVFDADLNNLQLTKLTPYFAVEDENTVNNPKQDMNGPAYVCLVTKLDFDVCDDIFCSGYDVFNIDRTNLSIEEKTTATYLRDSEFDIGEISPVSAVFIYSEFNLNCLTIRESLNRGIRTYNKENKTSQRTEGSGDDAVTYDVSFDAYDQEYIVSVNSQNCSLIYDLPLMYREYTRKYYSVVDDKTFTVFDNTVRSSNVDVDEVFRSIYKFDAEDYYNVPTNRGIIVNLFSINNEIFVHTEHGLFKFTDSSLLKVGDNLYSSNKEVGVSESSPFEIGIAEIVDSQYGHGGLQNKEHALITFNGYIFYDSLVRNIYSYDNQSGIQNITPPVRKIIDWFEPTDVTFVSDDANNRFFITLSKVINDTKQVICLSYSFISKSFVSIHDIDYTHAFNSRLNTYFIQGSNFLKVNYKDFGSYVNKYPSVLTIKDEASYDKDSVGSCIDIIINDGYEAIKALSHIHWICSSITDYVGENPYNVAEELITEYGGDNIRVYTDQTWTDLLPINVQQNTQLITDANSYQYPRYNNGIWTMNYFRDIKNADSNYISDEMSLIHGKYIVVRFIFGANRKNFKFENLNINFKNYEKV